MDDAKSVVAIIPKYYMQKDAAGNYIIHPKGIYKNEYGLCDKERFANEPVKAHCTGFAAGPNKIVTANHCIDKQTMKGFYFVFDYLADSEGKYATVFTPDKVYQAIDYVEGSVNHPNTDFAVIKVDKTIPSHRIARVNPNVNYSSGDLYHVIGCPCGIPLKMAPNAVVRTSSDPNFFIINSDTYGGNSGSPVFNSTSHLVEGILVSGEQDFSLQTGQCNISFLCPFNGCSGESVSKNNQFINYIH
jgi:V8-like Glu-specific endopeptidase